MLDFDIEERFLAFDILKESDKEPFYEIHLTNASIPKAFRK